MNDNLDGFTSTTNRQIECYLPHPRPVILQAFDIVDKFKDLEADFACEVLGDLVARFPEVQEYLVNNHIEILQEEEF